MHLTSTGKKRRVVIQLDEMWSFVGCKKQKRWLWCAYDTQLKRVIAHVFGCRDVATLNRLLKQLKLMCISVTFYCTGDFGLFLLILRFSRYACVA